MNIKMAVKTAQCIYVSNGLVTHDRKNLEFWAFETLKEIISILSEIFRLSFLNPRNCCAWVLYFLKRCLTNE